MSLWLRIANALRPDRLSREIDEELESHIEEAIAQGRDAADARRAFGNALRTREGSRDVRVIQWLDSLRADTIFGWRQLMKKKTSTAAAVLSLALAIGACTSAFRIIDALLLRPLSVSDPDRLHVIVFGNIGADGTYSEYDSCSYPMFLREREAVKQQAELIAVSYADRTDITFGSDEDMERAHTQYVSGSLFPQFGLNPAAGRLLTESDDVTQGASPFAVLSYDYWARRFGRDPSVVGRNFRLGDTLFQIVGIAPPAFTGTEIGTVTDVFLPMAMKNPRTLASSNNFWLRTFVKLRPGARPDAVHDRLRATFQDIQKERAATFTNTSKGELKKFFAEKLLLQPAAAGRSNMQRDYGQALAILAVLVALVLLVACGNLANLMTARAAARSREMALRVSIGAGRWRLVQLVLVESAWLAFLSTTLGALFAWRSAPLIVAMISPADDPTRLVLSADWRTLVFGLALAIVVTFLFGLLPAVRASAVRPASALKGGEDPHSRRRLMSVLIGAQVAFCFLVIFVAGLFTRTFDRLSSQATGIVAEGVLNLETTTRTPQPAAFWNEVAQHVRATPGVANVALTGWPLMSGESNVDKISIGGAPAGDVISDFLYASPGFAATMKIPVLDGRDFLPSESNPSVAIVNRAFAKQFFGGQNPTGKWFERVGPGSGLSGAGKRVRLQIVGLIPDVRSRDRMRRPILPTAWIPFQSVDAQNLPQPRSRGTFVVRTTLRDPLTLASALRASVTRTRPGFHVANIRTQIEINRSNTLRERLLATLAMFFAAVALLLAGVGLYGVLDYSVLQRRREIGIRIAIGAKSRDIARGVTFEVFSAICGGAIIGLALGMAGARYVESLLFGVKATDPRMFALPAVALAAVALLASLRPVIRAIRTDPAKMLRTD
jgi:predicted permease